MNHNFNISREVTILHVYAHGFLKLNIRNKYLLVLEPNVEDPNGVDEPNIFIYSKY